MDLIIAMLLMTGLGVYRMSVTRNVSTASAPVMKEDGTVEYPAEMRPIGDNLELLYEVDAYTFILRELGLK